MEGVTIFRRDHEGNLLERVEAVSSVYQDGSRSLLGVRRSDQGAPAENESAPLDWPQGQSPHLLHAASAHPKETPLVELLRVSAQSDLGTQPGYRYRVWLQERLAGPVTTMILIILTVALAQPFESRSGRGFLLAIWLATGFVCWTFDGLVLTFGEIGLLPPVLAAWAAPAVFAAMALWLMIQDERRKVEGKRPAAALG
jgi:lipopolysaccharide export system permease protein